ncbi:MAG: S-layer homology domain-containing protein [Clostridia bacterium]|nr:S-layer homology domain-containing protein [Clostridia bacterium]
MKNRKIIKSIIVLLTCFIFILPVHAATDTKLQNDSAKDLVKLNLLKGYPDGSLGLQNKIKRSEFITFVVRMLGYENTVDTSSIKVSFKDIDKKHWAYNNIKVALKYKLVSGYPDNTIAPEKNVSYAEALTVIIRALGYESSLSGNWPDNVINKANALGISKNVELPGKQEITRGDMSVLVHNSLTVDFAK